MIPWLDGEPDFPPVDSALHEPDGLLAAGGRLDPDWLIAAYERGIFPWFGPEDPILWWSPDPRMVLLPSAVRVSRSLRRRLRRGEFEIRFDTDFAAVIRACAQPREPGGGTWIVPAIQRAYLRMHELGHAHSVEAYADGGLVGGLYGIALGKVFFGESMFARVTDASKVALAHLARFLELRGFELIDCQMSTDHLRSMGGFEIARGDFARRLERLAHRRAPPERWPAGAAGNWDWSEKSPC